MNQNHNRNTGQYMFLSCMLVALGNLILTLGLISADMSREQLGSILVIALVFEVLIFTGLTMLYGPKDN